MFTNNIDADKNVKPFKKSTKIVRKNCSFQVKKRILNKITLPKIDKKIDQKVH
ncbi:hypothetical protein ACFL5G_05650 [Candidatus Margulisiibacteriota bacterium]